MIETSNTFRIETFSHYDRCSYVRRKKHSRDPRSYVTDKDDSTNGRVVLKQDGTSSHLSQNSKKNRRERRRLHDPNNIVKTPTLSASKTSMRCYIRLFSAYMILFHIFSRISIRHVNDVTKISSSKHCPYLHDLHFLRV